MEPMHSDLADPHGHLHHQFILVYRIKKQSYNVINNFSAITNTLHA